LSIWVKEADAITAILIGLYILHEIWHLGRELMDNLVDKSDREAEKVIRKTCSDEEIELIDLRSRRIGSKSFAELKIGLNKNWTMEIDNLELE